MGRTKGAVDLKPRKKRNSSLADAPVRPRSVRPSKATQRAMDRAQADLSNGVNIEAFNALAEIWFAQEDIIETYLGEHRARCKGPRGVQKKAIQRARDSGVPIEAAKLKLRLMGYDRSKEKARRDAEPDTLALVHQIELARNELGQLADTELGRAHIESLESTNTAFDEFRSTDFVDNDDPRPQFLRDRGQRVSENEDRLRRGIHQLDE